MPYETTNQEKAGCHWPSEPNAFKEQYVGEDPDGPPLSTSSHEPQWEQYRPAVTSDEVIPTTSYASYLPTPKSTSSPDLSRETEFVVVRMPDSIGFLNVAKACVPTCMSSQ